MSIIVAYKYAGNPQDAKVSSDGVVDWARVKKAVSCPILKLMDEDTYNVMLDSDIYLVESAHR